MANATSSGESQTRRAARRVIADVGFVFIKVFFKQAANWPGFQAFNNLGF